MQIFGFAVDWWTLVGFLGQLMFFSRFLVQWFVSERAGESVIPVAFWYFSIAGAVITFIYAYVRADLVFVAGQGLAMVIYSRNLYFIFRKKRREAAA